MTESNRHIQAVPEEVECSGHCYSLTESGTGYVDPKCPKHGSHSGTTLVDTGSMFVRVPKEQP